MKKGLARVLGVILSMVLIFSVAACGDKPAPAPSQENFTVTVVGGTGGGTFERDADCTVTAAVTEGKAFVHWTVDGKEVSAENPYTFKVTSDITVTAVLKDVYTVTATGGKINGAASVTASAGDTLTAVADTAEGKIFLGWFAGETLLSENAEYSFTADKSMNIEAKFANAYTITVTGGKIGGETSVTVKEGSEVTAVADTAAGKRFVGWFAGDTLLSENATYTFTAEKSVNLQAKFVEAFTVTVTGGKIDGQTSAVVDAGQSVTVVFDAAENRTFVAWKAGGETVSTDAAYTFTVNADVDLTAVYTEQLVAPENDANQMFKYVGNGAGRNTTELDRQKEADGTTKKTAFVEGVDYILYHVYTSPNANRGTDAVAAFKLLRDEAGKASLTTMDGAATLGVAGDPGNYFTDNNPTDEYFGFFEAVVGKSFDKWQNYYFAAQAIAVADSVYTNSAISEIGDSSIRKSEPVTVTVENGTGGGKVDKNSDVTVTATVAEGYYFVKWTVNGADVSTDNPYTFKAAQDVTITAVTEQKPAEKFTVSVTGGTGGGQFEAGEECTVTATVPDGFNFICWKADGVEVSKSQAYTFRVVANVSLTAEFADSIQLVAPKNDANQMFSYPKYGSGRNTTELDRQKDADGKSKTAFVEGVDYILYHVYTSPEANRDTDAIATFMLVKDENNAGRVVTMDGSVFMGCGNTPGNYYIDNTPDAIYFAFFRAVIGDTYSETQNYYFAAQSIAQQGTAYTNSEISEIGTVSICEK